MDLTTKRWSSLSQLKGWLLANNPKEKILYFDGIYLKTTEAVYGLGDTLFVYDKDSALYSTVDKVPEKAEEKVEKDLTDTNEDSNISKVEPNKESAKKKKKRRKKKVSN